MAVAVEALRSDPVSLTEAKVAPLQAAPGRWIPEALEESNRAKLPAAVWEYWIRET